ncbi:MAG TPA: TonB-dependent receptor, partial [Bacteroidia bacterium]
MLKEDLSIKAAYTIMNQYVHLLSNTGIGLPTDLWVPSTKNVGPQHSQQFALGAAKDLPKKNLTVSLEGYYKLSTDIIGYKEGASFLPADDPSGSSEIKWEDNITRGKSWSYGAELFIQRKFGKFTGWLGYTLSWTWMQFDSLNYGKKFFARYDRRHDISLVGIYKLNDHITISATWVFGTGNAITLPLSTYQTVFHNPGGSSANTAGPSTSMLYYVEDYGDKNAFRMTPYHRMDIGIQFMKKKKHCDRTFEVGVYNVYNHMNPYFYYIQQTNGVNKLMQVSLFPIIPSVSWTYKF